MGDVYAALDGVVLRISPDGAIKELEGGGFTLALVETGSGRIVRAVGWVLLQLNEADEWELLADAGGEVQAVVPLPDGSVVVGATKRLVRILADGTVKVLHEYTNPAEGGMILSLFLDPFGNIWGNTYDGGAMLSGTVFVCEPGGRYQVLEALRSPTREGIGSVWLDQVFPHVARAMPLNLPPAARWDTVAPRKGRTAGAQTFTVDALANDSDANGDGLTITALGAPRHGTAALEPASGRIVYTPANSAPEFDTFTYTVNDGMGGSAVGRVIVQPSRAGNYRGVAHPIPDGTSGDSAGSVSVRVNEAGAFSARANLFGRQVSFSGQFNERNLYGQRFGSAFDERAFGIQLWLEPVGQDWQVRALIIQNGQRHEAICAAAAAR